VAINQLLFFKGLSLTSPIHAAIMLTVNPIAVLVLLSFTFKTMPNWKAILGIALGISGALYLILRQGASEAVSYSISGDVLVLLNSVSYAIYLILAKPLLSKYQANTLLFFTFILGWFMVLPFGFAEFSEIRWQSIPAIDYLKITFVVFGATFLAYLFNAYGLKRVNPTGVSVYIYLQPVLATFIAISFSNDQLSALELTAALMIFAGIYFTNLSQSRN
jgi:drug/metabolite transporter (DMT)-like permease